MANFITISRNRIFITNVLCGGFILSGLVAFLSSSSGVMQGYFGIEPSRYGLLVAIASVGSLLGSYVAGTLVVRIGMNRLIEIGLSVCILGGVSMTVLAVMEVHSPLIIVIPMFFFMSGFMLITPQITAGALTPFQSVAGTASSLSGFIQNLMGAGTSALLAVFGGTGGALPMAGVIATAGLGAALIYFTLIRPQGRP